MNWEVNTLDLFADKIREKYKDQIPEVILDIGTRDLESSIEISKHFPNTRIISFEPTPEQYAICLEKSKHHANIEVHNFALSDEEGEVDFWVVDGNVGGSSMFEPIDVPYSSGTWNKIKVQSKRLDVILKSLNVSKVDAIWIDTQGAELKVLNGMGMYLDEVQVIHTEACPRPYYKGQVEKGDLEKFLVENNFTLDQFIPAPNHPYDEGDWICVRNSETKRISLICACKNRYDALRISLNSWISFKQIHEIIIVDWDSDKSISHLTKLDSRIKVIEVKNKDHFNQPQPLNLAAKIATGNYIMKVDCDYIINPYFDFFSEYVVDANSFVSGKSRYVAPEYYSETYGGYVIDMHQMKPEEIVQYTVSYSHYFKFLIGFLLISKKNFDKVGGYNENLTKCYAYEDEELYERLKLLGLNEINLKPDYRMIHLPHPDKKRTEYFEGFSWESDFVKMVQENMRRQGHTEEEVKWQVEYALAQKHIDQNKEFVGEITDYYVQPKTRWRVYEISKNTFSAVELLSV